MSAPTILDQLITLLDSQKQAGTRYIHLSPESQDFLADPGAPSAASPTRAYLEEEPEEKAAPAPAKPAAAPPPERPAPVRREEVPVRHEETPARPAANDTPPPQPAPTIQEAQPLPDLGQLDLAAMEQVVAPCVRCKLCESRRQTVFGEGNPQADLMFIGEGPGQEEDRTGRPFVGKAGKLLTDIIHAMQFSREDVYIANIVKCRPPNNRNPEDEEAASCLPYLRRQIELIQPQVIVTLGAIPLKHLLNKRGILRLRGRWLSYEDTRVMPTLHPSYVLRKPESKADVWADMQQVMRVFGKDPRQSTRRRR